MKRYSHKETDCLYIKTKLFYRYGPELEKTWEHIQKNTENNIDGLIFTPIDHPIIFNRDYDLLKWKEDHTMDLFVKIVGKKINLYYNKKNENVLFKSYPEKSENYQNIVKFLKDPKKQLKTGVIIEFKYTPDKDLFECYRLRTDKDKPNGEITVNNTLTNITENLKILDLVAS